MNKMTNSVKEARTVATTKATSNFMGGTSYEVNPLDTLKMVTASSIFGEPQYYRHGEFADAKVIDGVFRTHKLVESLSVLDKSYKGLKTSELMERVIDAALDHDFAGTLDWAVTLRKEYNMRLNPQVIMVRAAMHSRRQAYTEANPGKFGEIQNLVMSRADEPASQLTYWLYRNKSKNKIPSVLKRSWANKVGKFNRYQMAKYKNSGIGMIDVVRISHAKGHLVDELVKTGTVEFQDNNVTWEKLKSEGKTWSEILNTIKIPHMALLRNLRGIFTEINDLQLCKQVLEQLKTGVVEGKQFPFRYYTAMNAIEASSANHKSLILDALEECIDLARNALPKLSGKTISLSDNSGSAWGTFNSEFGSVTVAEIDNLSGILTAQNSDEGYVGIFGDRLEIVPISKRNGALSQAKDLRRIGKGIGGGTENGVWLFFDRAIKNKEHWDTIFIYSDMQAGHGGLYGRDQSQYKDYVCDWNHIDVMKLVKKYRETVNPNVNIFCVQTAGYTNVVVPETIRRGAVLYGWTGKETLYADSIIKLWDEIDARKNQQ